MDFPMLTGICGDIDALLEAHQSRTPRHFPGGDVDRFKNLFSLRSAEETFTNTLVPAALIGVVRGGSTTPINKLVCSFPVGIGGNDSDFIDPTKIREAFSNGSTVLVRGVQTFWSPMRDFARDLEAEISHPVSINCYITPPDSVGLSRHYDMHEVIVLQVEGSKRWEIGPRGFLNPLEGKHPFKATSGGITEETTVTMKAGDSLYVPRGYLHRCTAGGSVPSLHLTIGILTRSRFDILSDFVEGTVDEPQFRLGMPWGFLRDGPEGPAAVEETVVEFSQWAIESVDKALKREQGLMDSVRRVPESRVFV